MRIPEAVRIEASVAAVEPLPLVPAMSTEGKRRCGWSSAASRSRISSSENLRRDWPELRVKLRHHGVELIDGRGIRHGKFSIEGGCKPYGMGLQECLRPQKQLQRAARALQACPRLIFREQPLMHGFFAGVVHLVGDARKVRIDAGEKQIVVHLVQQVAQSSGVTVAGADQAGERGGQGSA